MSRSGIAEEEHLAETAASPGPPGTRALGFSRWDRAAVTAYAKGDPDGIDELVEDTRQLAEVLAGPVGDAARVRLLARTAAACRSQLRLLEGMLAQRVAARDFEAVTSLSRVVDGVAKRMVLALRQLSVESALRQRPSVVIRHAERVDFAGGSR